MSVRVLVPIDANEASSLCEVVAGNIAQAIGAELTLFHALDLHGIHFKNITGMHLDIIRQRAWEKAQASMRITAEEMGRCGDTPRVVLIEGEPSVSVCAEANRGYEFIMLGAEVHSDLRYILLGSVSSSLINQCQLPIFVIKEGGADLAEVGKEQPLRVLLALDDSHASQRCVEFFAGLGVAGGMELTLAHTVVNISAVKEEGNALLDKYSKRLGVAGYSVKTILTEGSPGDAIIKLTEEGTYDFVAAGKAKPQEHREGQSHPVGHYLFHHCKLHQVIVP